MANGCSYVYKYWLRQGQACGGEVWAEGLCIGHYPGPKDEAAFERELEARQKAFNGDFEGWVFPGTTRFDVGGLKTTNFQYACFLGLADFSALELRTQANFLMATFSENANFFNTTFHLEPIFVKTTFNKEAEFTGANFKKDSFFSGAAFTGNAMFAKTTFEGEANFATTIFRQEADFSEATWPGRGLFQRTRFEGPTKFAGDASHLTFRFITRDQDPPRSLEDIAFRNTYGLEEAVFEDVDWGTLKVRGPLGLPETRDFVAGDELRARESKKREDYAAAEAVYRALRRSYETRKDYMRANGFYYWEMEMRLLQLPWWRPDSILLRLYGILSGYGVRWRRALGWYGAILLLSTLGYAALGYEMASSGSPSGGALYYWWQPSPGFSFGVPGDDLSTGTVRLLIHSFRATLLQREPELRPLHWAGFLLEGLETALGPILLFLLGLCVRRRFQR